MMARMERYFQPVHRREMLFKVAWITSLGMLVFGCIMIAVMWNG
jgi:hypothetical protein